MEFHDRNRVHTLATHLLEKVVAGGGYGFINRLELQGIYDPVVHAKEVLRLWCESNYKKGQECSKRELYIVMNRALPIAAKNFRYELGQ